LLYLADADVASWLQDPAHARLTAALQATYIGVILLDIRERRSLEAGVKQLKALLGAVALAAVLVIGDIGYASEAHQQRELEKLVVDWWQVAASSGHLPECDAANPSNRVWFLAGTTGNPVDQPVQRTCTVPARASIFLPVFAVEWSSLEGACPLPAGSAASRRDPGSAQDLIACADAFADHVRPDRDLRLTIDGRQVQNLQQYRVQTEAFPIRFAENNEFGVPPGKGKAAADGYWLLLPPLDPGRHTIQFAATVNFPALGFTFETSADYTVIVTPDRR
jgi:hypothetical protein